MEMRSTTVTVTFRQGFFLPGHEAPFPAGTYEVLSEDERLEGLTFEAYRRVATFLRIRGQGAAAALRLAHRSAGCARWCAAAA